ncbi:hypothetical protein BWI15_30080 [Kribbella sp. ALI-6-A]|uniref:hypothetical protein n=1 Tax=Kribbella sp. ALI-6-A TaxID=1933817 RepID=UPI00097C5363|nr:hypothetical protein [Kribbella sp. ALI-6-A]ONI67382.1 hypothetical protein BWI15_30080 [Kribbella sp. ALI-6-A]
MNKSDDELGELLRETFASQENQADSLPAAIKSRNRRRFAPVLAAAAAVVLVLGGGVVVRQNLTPPTAEPAPAATTTAHAGPGPSEALALTEDIRIWAAAIEAIIAREPGSTTYYVLDAPHQNGSTARGTPFTDAQKTAITGLLATTTKLEWIAKRPPLADPCAPDAGGPFVTVGSIVRRAGHVEVDASVWRGCLAARWLTFRLDEKAGTWKVTGTVGPEAVS